MSEYNGFKIDSGVPLPPKRNGRQHTKYPWGEMTKGDSTFIPSPRPAAEMTAKRRRAYCQHISKMAKAYGAKHGMEFTSRQVIGGVRVWRIA